MNSPYLAVMTNLLFIRCYSALFFYTSRPLFESFHLSAYFYLNLSPYVSNRFPWLGVEKAEIITALCSMLHGPLAKADNQAFASITSIIDSIAANPVFMQYADSIAQLFLDRFR